MAALDDPEVGLPAVVLDAAERPGGEPVGMQGRRNTWNVRSATRDRPELTPMFPHVLSDWCRSPPHATASLRPPELHRHRRRRLRRKRRSDAEYTPNPAAARAPEPIPADDVAAGIATLGRRSRPAISPA